MEKSIGKDIADKAQRKQFLLDNCDAVEERGYMKHLSNRQIEERKNALAEISIQIKEIETKKKEINDVFKLQLKPLTEEKEDLIDVLKTKALFVNEKVYKFVDRETRMTEWYNAEGDMIDSRPANIDELPDNVFSVARNATGTNN